MLRQGLLNPALLGLLARVRHTNTLVIADRGFPSWPGLETVDLSLIDDVPTVAQVLAALRANFVIGRVFAARELHEANTASPEPLARHLAALDGLPLFLEPHLEFKHVRRDAQAPPNPGYGFISNDRSPTCSTAKAGGPLSLWDGFAAGPRVDSPSLMNPVLKLLLEGGRLTTAQMAQVAGLSVAEVEQHLEQLKKDKIFLGWRPVLDLSRDAAAGAAVRAVIEVKLTPERGGGFNRMAERLCQFDEVESCHLMSGSYDLLVFVNAPTLQKAAAFVSEKLSTFGGVLSTSTHFLLRSYKEGGFRLDDGEGSGDRLNVSP